MGEIITEEEPDLMNCIRFFYTIADFNKYQMTEDFIGSEQDMVKPIHVTCAGPDSQVLKINYCSAYDKIIFATALNQQGKIYNLFNQNLKGKPYTSVQDREVYRSTKYEIT